MDTIQKKSWYQKKWLLILLLFILPPVGVFGILKKHTKTWKKVVYTILGVFMSFYLLGVLLLVFTPNFDFQKGNKLYTQGKYEKAIFEYKKVEKDDENYNEALQKIVSAENKLDSISDINKQAILLKRKDSIAKVEMQNHKMEVLKLFQKQWADSILKSESKLGNRHFVAVKYSLPDTILFEYTTRITKNGFDNNFNVDIKAYPKHYKETLSKKLGAKYLEFPCHISFIPNQKVVAKNNPSEWQNPVMMNVGLKVYSGTQYSKTYIGTLNCKFKDQTEGKTYFVVLKSNGKEVMIENYKFRKFYWVKKQDHKDRIGTGLNQCY